MKYSIIFTTIITLALSSQVVTAGTIADPSATGEILTATKMNEIRDAVNDNNDRININTINIGANTSDIGTKQDRVTGTCAAGSAIDAIASDGSVTCESIPAIPTVNVISFPARSLAYSPTSTTISDHALGLSWVSTFSGGTTLVLSKPLDYTTGDIAYKVFFQTTSATAAAVSFFIRPTSYNSGDGTLDPGSVSATGPVAVSGTSGFGTVYEQTIIIPSARMTKDWWWITMQRGGTGETYADDVIVTSVSLSYNTN